MGNRGLARLARVVAINVPHHVTQRGNARRFILESDSDELVYIDFLRQCCALYEISLLGYGLMFNHVLKALRIVSTEAELSC